MSFSSAEATHMTPTKSRPTAGGFAGRSSMAGTTDPAFLGARARRHPGARLRASGRWQGHWRRPFGAGQPFDAHRLSPQSDGELDPGFGDAGVMRYAPDECPHAASAVALDADGRIVVAGTRDGVLIVLSLTASGDVDTSFGDRRVVCRSTCRRGCSSADPADGDLAGTGSRATASKTDQITRLAVKRRYRRHAR